jgi:hypothetical protein
MEREKGNFMLKDWPRVYRKLKRMRGLDEHEKVLYARSIAATPDERWQMNVTFLRSLGLWRLSDRKKFGFNS